MKTNKQREKIDNMFELMVHTLTCDQCNEAYAERVHHLSPYPYKKEFCNWVVTPKK